MDVAAGTESAVSSPALAYPPSPPPPPFGHISSSEVPNASTTGTGTGGLGGSERKCAPGGVREVIQWHPCYGRQSDSETHIEKGEIYLGLQLERDA